MMEQEPPPSEARRGIGAMSSHCKEAFRASRIGFIASLLLLFVLGLVVGLLIPTGGGDKHSSTRLGGSPLDGGRAPSSAPASAARNELCIANREDNSIHIFTQVELACSTLSANTGIPWDELNCELWDEAPAGSAAPPRSCSGNMFNAWNKADWVFSTWHQITGTCPPFPSKSYNATALVPANQLSSFVNPPVLAVCARGWDGKSVYNLTQ